MASPELSAEICSDYALSNMKEEEAVPHRRRILKLQKLRVRDERSGIAGRRPGSSWWGSGG